LGSGKKKPRRESKAGNVALVRTQKMDKTSIRASELDKDAVVFISADFEDELSKANLFVLDYVGTLRGKYQEEQLQLFEELDTFLSKNKDKIWTFAGHRSPYVVNSSIFKTPQNIVKVASNPEKLFVYGLIENAKYIDAWVKSRDMGFYSIEYEYFRKGKDRVRRTFNPDFFIKIDLDKYITLLREEGIESQSLGMLQDKGIDIIIRAIEIKSEDDDDESTPAKKKYAEEHFTILNEKLLEGGNLPAEILSEKDNHTNHLYIFDLLIPLQFDHWFQDLRRGQDERYDLTTQ
jgi:type III restriction enzyme